MTQRVFVTGGSGFVGRALIRRLREQQYEVVAIARSEAAARAVERAGARAVTGDLSDTDALVRGMTGASWVAHAAAKVEQWGPIADFMRINVEGTENVLRTARTAKVPRVVHVSTEAVLVGGNRALVRVNETWARPASPPPPYALTKALAEQRVLAANTPELATVVVRPRFVWGAGDTSLLPKLVDAVKKNQFAWFSGGHYLTSTCHVDNVAAGILAAARSGKGGSAYFLTDGEPIEFRRFISQLIESQGLDAPTRSIPLPLAKIAARLIEMFWPTSSDKPPPLTRTMLALMGTEVTVDDAKARTEIGYQNVITREQGLREMTQVATPAMSQPEDRSDA
jgi:nucleoside-diphosphate-sugar epimerase